MTDPALVVCRGAIAKHSKSFAFASLLLPRRARDDAAAIYAWCRRADDAVDLASPESQSAAVERLRSELEAVYAGLPQSEAALIAFQGVVERARIPRAYPEALLDGMAMDAAGERYPSVERLLLYCYRVAATVGLMMCHVLGVSHPRALRHAAHLGMAMQLTNICRDVAEDWQRGRLYVPETWVGLTPDRPVALASARGSLRLALKRLAKLSTALYRSGDRGLRYLPWRTAVAIRTARLVYAAIGWRIALRGYDVLAGRATVPMWGKALLALGALVRSLVTLPGALLRWPGRARDTKGGEAATNPIIVRYPHDVLCL